MDTTNATFQMLSDLINSPTMERNDGIKEQLFKLRTIDKHKKTCRATNILRHLWTQFDFDFSEGVNKEDFDA